MLRSRSPSPWLRAGLSGALPFAASLGLSGCPEGSLTPTVSPTTLAVGFDHACALRGSTTTNEAVCWGGNGDGELGVDVADQRRAVPGLTGVLQVAANSDQTCALLTGGSVRCWGRQTLTGGASTMTPLPPSPRQNS